MLSQGFSPLWHDLPSTGLASPKACRRSVTRSAKNSLHDPKSSLNFPEALRSAFWPHCLGAPAGDPRWTSIPRWTPPVKRLRSQQFLWSSKLAQGVILNYKYWHKNSLLNIIQSSHHHHNQSSSSINISNNYYFRINIAIHQKNHTRKPSCNSQAFYLWLSQPALSTLNLM